MDFHSFSQYPATRTPLLHDQALLKVTPDLLQGEPLWVTKLISLYGSSPLPIRHQDFNIAGDPSHLLSRRPFPVLQLDFIYICVYLYKIETALEYSEVCLI